MEYFSPLYLPVMREHIKWMRCDTGMHGEHICYTEILRKTLSVLLWCLGVRKGLFGKKYVFISESGGIKMRQDAKIW